MTLKFKYLKREEIPTELVSHYSERDGAWQLEGDGVADPSSVEQLRRADKAKLDEFRQNNITLSKQLEDQKRRFEGGRSRCHA